jgi:hypothetical protein
MREQGHLGSREGLGSFDEFIDGLHQRLDGAVRVVSGDVVVELLPEPFDDVRLRRVRREEVEHDAPAELRQVAPRPPRLVDDEVVEDEVDALGTPVGAAEGIDQGEEEIGVLPFSDDVDALSAPGVERADHVPLHVLAGHENDELLAAAHVRAADARVGVDVDLVDLARRPLLPLVEEGVLAEILESVERAVDGGASAAGHLGDSAGDNPLVEQQQDPGAERLDAAAGLAEESHHPASLPSVEPKGYRHRGGSPGVECVWRLHS